MIYLKADNFEEWRAQARDVLSRGLTPFEVGWEDGAQYSFFETKLPQKIEGQKISVSKEFLSLAKVVSYHRSTKKWDLLYQLLFRMHCGEKNLMKISTDPVMRALQLMQKSVRFDAHKTKAFVRFRKIIQDGEEHYIAWHQPDHLIIPFVAPFFSRRFADMSWTIITPDASVSWDGEELHYGPGMSRDAAPESDELEDLWRDYYRATFNPARIKLKAMRKEMPKRYWHTMPETEIITELLNEAPERVRQMIALQPKIPQSAAEFLPVEKDIEHLRIASKACEGCELHKYATQTVFGEGPANARLMLVGEQPGDEEDKTGKPFIGPAGKLLDEALSSAGLKREEVYITNAVKHFRFLYKESQRHHRSPSPYHIKACKPWLDAEIAAIQPKAILCLGNSAARSLISPGFSMKTDRGILHGNTPILMATFHPASILRARGSEQEEQRNYLFEDILKAIKLSA